MVVFKGLILDYWLIRLCQMTICTVAHFYQSVFVCMCVSVDCHTGQNFWLNWPMANSGIAVGLHPHHCLLCTALLMIWLVPVSSYVVHILAHFPH